jgi:hypothetical protein
MNLVRILMMLSPIRRRKNRETKDHEKGRSQESHDLVFSHESCPSVACSLS